jgi:lysophospholipase L1-like esterase
MGQVAVRFSRPLAVMTAPVTLTQGRRVRATTPVLPEAAGRRAGIEGAGTGGSELALLVLGESTAAGVGVATQADGLGRQTAAALARRASRSVRWRVVAQTGTTAKSALTRLVPQIGSERYDIVAVTLGVNDVLRLTSRARWRHDTTALTSSLLPHLRPGGRMVICGVPDLAAFPALPSPLRTVLGWHARNLDRGLAQVTAASAAALHMPVPALAGPELWAGDSFHPNAEGYRQWATGIVSAAVATHT